MINLSLLNKKSNNNPEFEGKWHAINFQPDLSVPQYFIIGVAISQKGRLTNYRIAEEADKLKHFYGKKFTQTAWKWMREELINDLSQAHNSNISTYQSLSPQISMGEGFYASGSSAESVISRTFERIVTVIGNERRERIHGVNQTELRKIMEQEVKKRISTRFEAIYLKHGLIISDGQENHKFDITYDDNITASSVVSASYASLELAQLNIMTATSDLQALRHIKKRQQIGVAVLTPSKDRLTSGVVNEWKKWWSDHSYKMRESSKILLAESSDTEELAAQISNWYPENQT